MIDFYIVNKRLLLEVCFLPKRKTLDEKSESTKSNYIQFFDARSEEILRKKLSGATNKAIAEEMGLSENRVSFIVTSPIFQAKQTSSQEIINNKFQNELATDPVKRKFHEHRERAADVIISEMDNIKSPKIRMEAANDVLGYDGYTKKPAEDHSTKIFIDADMSRDIYVAVKELKIDADLLKELNAALDVEGDVVDIEAGGDKSESISGVGEKELLGVLQGDNEEQLADEGSTPSTM